MAHRVLQLDTSVPQQEEVVDQVALEEGQHGELFQKQSQESEFNEASLTLECLQTVDLAGICTVAEVLAQVEQFVADEPVHEVGQTQQLVVLVGTLILLEVVLQLLVEGKQAPDQGVVQAVGGHGSLLLLLLLALLSLLCELAVLRVPEVDQLRLLETLLVEKVVPVVAVHQVVYLQIFGCFGGQ